MTYHLQRHFHLTYPLQRRFHLPSGAVLDVFKVGGWWTVKLCALAWGSSKPRSYRAFGNTPREAIRGIRLEIAQEVARRLQGRKPDDCPPGLKGLLTGDFDDQVP